MDEVTAGNTRGQLVGSGVWVQVPEIFKSGQKIRKLHVSEKKKHIPPGYVRKERGRVQKGVEPRGDRKVRIVRRIPLASTAIGASSLAGNIPHESHMSD